jgi:leader peptidase (prepilin peptidase)/N-methyltransferase
MFSIAACFIVHFIVDLKHQILPDGINIYLAFLFLVKALMLNSWFSILLGASIGFGFPYLISFIFYKLKGQIGLGGGDIKLWGALGIYLGPTGIIHNIFLSCFVGSIIGGSLLIFKFIKRETPIPFGPFIIITAVLQIYFSSWLNTLLKYIS